MTRRAAVNVSYVKSRARRRPPMAHRADARRPSWGYAPPDWSWRSATFDDRVRVVAIVVGVIVGCLVGAADLAR